MKKVFSSKTLVAFVFLTFVAATIYVAVMYMLAPSEPVATDQNIRLKGDYALMLLQCALGTVIMMLPEILRRKCKIAIPQGMVAALAVFLYCAIYLGEVQSFYFRIEHWDTLLHTFSGVALGAIGVSIIGLLHKSKSVSISPAFVALFAFCFAVAAGTVWEIYEYAVDSITNLNMQKYMLESGEALVGQAALADTMKDILVDTLGALAISVVAYVSMKRKEGWLERMQLRRNRPELVPQPAYAAQKIPLVPQVQPAIVAADNSPIPEPLPLAL